MRLAITGATGFVGSHLLDAAVAAGNQVNALTRREQRQRDGVRWVEGDLSSREALRLLVDETDAVIHVAGVINARTATDFDKGNVEGTLSILAAATAAGTTRFVHTSSLAAREPGLSLYGRSKARSEELVEGSGLDWVIVRPPALYGPGDKETLDLFRMAKQGRIFMPPKGGRASYLHVDDLARLLLALAEADTPAKALFEPDDGRAGGWTHRDIGEALSRAVGVPARTVHVPRPVLALAARADRLIRGSGAKLTPDRAAYFSHSDWVTGSDRKVPGDLWEPQIDTREGLIETARWYRSQGWL